MPAPPEPTYFVTVTRLAIFLGARKIPHYSWGCSMPKRLENTGIYPCGFRGKKLRSANAIFLAASACVCVYGQATSGNIVGTVTDSAGTIIPNVSITITSQERGTVYNATGNESGNYSVVQILPGLYTIEFEASGFQTTFAEGCVCLHRSLQRAWTCNSSLGR